MVVISIPSKKTKEQAILEIKNALIEKHNNKYTFIGFENDVYKDRRSKIIVQCPIHGEWKSTIEVFAHRGNGCRKCGNANKRRYSNDKAISIIDKYIQDNNLAIKFKGFVDGNYVDAHCKLILECEEHGEWNTTSFNNFLRGKSCPKCGVIKNIEPQRLSEEEVINRINESNKMYHNNRYRFIGFKDGRYVNQNTKLILECPEHGTWETSTLPSFYRQHQGCPKCSISHGENFISSYLNNNCISFYTQKKFNTCKDKRPLPFDFYLPDYNVLIEYDGRQHFESVKDFGGENNLYYIQSHDAIKTKWAYDNGYLLLRLNYKQSDDEIINILNELLVAKAEKIS